MSSDPATPAPPAATTEPARPFPGRRLALLAFALAGVALLAAVRMQSQPASPGTTAITARGLPPSHPAVGTGAAPGPAASAPHALEPGQIQALAQRLAERLAERLARQPDDADGWVMLARTHALSGQHAQAVEAFRQAAQRRPADAVLLADFADALAMTQQRQLAGEPLALVQRALKLDPANLKALSLAGTEAFDRGDFAGAVRHWQALQAAGGPDSVFVQQVQGGLIEARSRAGLAPAPPAPAAPLASGVTVKIGRGPGL